VNYLKLKAHFLNWREWELNPVVIKELRQSVRSWAVTGMLLLFLVVLFCTALTFLITQSFELSVNQRLGGQIFQVFTGILTGASLLFIPLYVGIRLAAERQDSNLDLLYITTLTPSRIIRGKFLCGAYMTVLFFSACMPFMAFTNLLRGVDLPTVAFILLCLFLVVCVMIQVAIFLACLPVSKLFKVLIGLAGLAAMFPVTAMVTAGFFQMMRSGVGSMMGGARFWTISLTVTGLVLAAVVLLYLLSVALISPLSANRALPLRGYLTGIWIAGFVACGYWAFKMRNAQLILPWVIITLVIMAVALVVVISNQDQLSLRVRRKIPASSAKRALAFLFYNGAAGGLVWISLIVTLTVVTAWVALHLLPEWRHGFTTMVPENLDAFDIEIGATVLYGFAYALTALFIHRQFLARRSPKLAGIFFVLLPAIWALLPNVALFFTNRLSFRAMEATQLGNVFNLLSVRDRDQRIAHLICATAWFVLALILNARWFSRQRKQFRPLEKLLAPEPATASVPPPIPTQTTVP
jgi:hypothetical protein